MSPEYNHPLQSSKLPRRQFIKRSLAFSAATLAAGGVLYAAPFDSREVVVEHLDLYLNKLPVEFDGFTIAQLSDFHYGPFTPESLIRHSVSVANELHADLAVLTGDFVTLPLLGDRKRASGDAMPCAELLSGIRTRLGVFAVLGNHDAWTNPSAVEGALHMQGIRVLQNQAVAIEENGARFWIAGVGDVSAGKAEIWNTLKRRPRDELTILLAHEPDYADDVLRSGYEVDLQLSGHSHGGQVRLPLVGPLFLPDLGRKYPLGFRQLGSLLLYTNRGIGMIEVPVRFRCPPEVTLFTLRTKQPV